MNETRPGHERSIAKTIELTDRDLQDVARLLTRLGGITGSSKDATPEPANQDNHDLVLQAAALVAARSRRLKYFNSSMFGEPAWDMLLTLYTAQTNGMRLTISRLTESSGAPPTTALRWLDYLEDQLLVKRDTHPTDARSFFVGLTDKARERLELYLSETLAHAR